MAVLRIVPFRKRLTLRNALGEVIVPPSLGPALDVRAEGEDYVLTAAVPGLKPEDLTIEVLDDTVTLQGEWKTEDEKDDGRYLLRERRYGQFRRSLTLPTALDSDKAAAAVENGVLTVRLPIADEAKPQVVAVTVKK
jgi:HSP20 family protein